MNKPTAFEKAIAYAAAGPNLVHGASTIRLEEYLSKNDDYSKFMAYCFAGYHPLDAVRLLSKDEKISISPETRLILNRLKALAKYENMSREDYEQSLNGLPESYRRKVIDIYTNYCVLNGSPGNASDSRVSASSNPQDSKDC